MIPRTSDGQLLFLLNNVSKMKTDTPLGSRIAEVHNGSSIFTGDAGGGESNARRYLIENDLVEAIIGLPDKMFYNTPLNTFIWILTNKKEERRKGKIQLIDATEMKRPLRKKLGDKSNELTPEFCKQILDVYMAFEETDISHIYENSEFGFWKISIMHPEYSIDGEPKRDSKGKLVFDKSKNETEFVPFTYEGGIDTFFENEVLAYTPDAVIDEKKTQIGYEISFTKCFFRPVKLRKLSSVIEDIKSLESETAGILDSIIGGEF